MTVVAFHQALTTEHFRDQRVPPLRKLRDLLSGDGLPWELVEAAADVCFPHERAANTAARLAPLKELWRAAQAAQATPTGGEALPAVTRELLEAKDRAIAAYQEIDRARQAYQASEQGRLQALQAATVVLALLGQSQSKIAELKREIDALQGRATPAPDQLATAQKRLERAVGQEQGLRNELARAEHERDTAQQVADHAARRINELEDEVAWLKSQVGGEYEEASLAPAVLPGTERVTDGGDDAALDDVDRTLDKVRAYLDLGHEAIQEAADEVGWSTTHQTEQQDVTVVTGHVVEDTQTQAEPNRPDTSMLSRTTRDNQEPAGEAPTGTDRHQYVGAATRRIARGIDLDETLLGLCHATVPAFSDTALVYLRDPLPIGEARPVGPLVLQLRRVREIPTESPNDCGTRTETPAERVTVKLGEPLAEVLRSVRPVLGTTQEATESLREIFGSAVEPTTGSRSIIAPLRGRRRVIGMVVFQRTLEREIFEPEDLLIAAQLATHAALGVEKSTPTQEGDFADHLQRSMLPMELPNSTKVELASFYLPVENTTNTGGDWFDAIQLEDDRVGLAIGDVAGRSATAAAHMGQLRTSIQAMAEMESAPNELLRRLDIQAQRLDIGKLATCTYAIYNPNLNRVTLASAGHPPPIMLHPNGVTEVLPVPPGPPIGVGVMTRRHFPCEAVEHKAPPGSILILYTNGLVASRTQEIEDGIEKLCLLLEKFTRNTNKPVSLDGLCDAILDTLNPGDRDDDMALLVARQRGT
ncbi:SpoIIE family protein phosphatase [Streptomyces sp. ODS28]|uniref:PP2C family protein-serine/threonine phosphatase n=1 Tax=Streptomyces sp. ODS28 TaxID=3136688 RepID=UPI0031F01035